MITVNEVIALYFRAWNSQTLEESTRLVEECCSPEVAYVDPKSACRGVAGLSARIRRSRLDAPTFRVDVASAIDGYDDTFRYEWVFLVEDAKYRVPGLDVVVLAKDGRIATITSFFGALEGLAAGAPVRVQPRWRT
jgi:hypothetical protein